MNTTHKIQGLVAVAILIVVTVVATGFVLPGGNDRANRAWSDRLIGQAAYEQQQARTERAIKAWGARLTAEAASLMGGTDLVAAAHADRAMKAWSDRLTAQAAAEAAAK